jgi:hypothetical protein
MDDELEDITIPIEEFFRVNDFGWFDKSTSVMEVGDVTGDNRENIILYGPNRRDLVIWGDDQINGWSKMANIPVDFNRAQDPITPVIVPINVEPDGPVLKYADAEYKLVFTEPVIMAVLAAAPCFSDQGQVTGKCTTSYGTGTIEGEREESRVTVTASVTGGIKPSFKLFGVGVEAELTQTFSGAFSQIDTSSYETRKTLTHTTGPIEDKVIFTTIPLDQYTYEILSHPNPDLIGESVVVSLPRDPITLAVEREFFNQHVADDSINIDSAIFQHTPGDPMTYPTSSQKNQLVQSRDGLESERATVGQGGGDTKVKVKIFQRDIEGTSYNGSWTANVKTTAAGVVRGFSVGWGIASTLMVTTGETWEYTGSVGDLDNTNFSANQYNFGLFSYVYEDLSSGKKFEVLNYWVE